MVHNRRTRVRRKKRCNSTIKKGGKGETLYVNHYKVFDIKSDNEKCRKIFIDAKKNNYNVFVFVKNDDGKWNTNLILAKPPSEYEKGTDAGTTYENASKDDYKYCVAMLITRY